MEVSDQARWPGRGIRFRRNDTVECGKGPSRALSTKYGVLMRWMVVHFSAGFSGLIGVAQKRPKPNTPVCDIAFIDHEDHVVELAGVGGGL